MPNSQVSIASFLAVPTSKNNVQRREQIIQLETQIIIMYINAFSPEKHCTLICGRSALSILLFCHTKMDVYSSQNLTKLITFTVSSRTFLSKIGIFF